MSKGTGWLATPALAAAVLIATACGGDDEGDGNGATTQATVGAEELTAAITNLENGDILEAGDIEVTLDVGDFEVVDKLGDPPVEGEGHVHFYLNAGEIPTTPGQPAVTAETTYHAEATTTYTWLGVRPGEHVFAVQLVNNDHTPLEPAITDEVTVTVE
jgi:hypothetical protein